MTFLLFFGLSFLRLSLIIRRVQHGLQLLWQEFVVVHVEGDLLALLGEDAAGEKDVKTVVDASSKVLYTFTIKFFLG